MAIPPQGPWMKPANPLTNLVSEVEDKDEAGVWCECNVRRWISKLVVATANLQSMTKIW